MIGAGLGLALLAASPADAADPSDVIPVEDTVIEPVEITPPPEPDTIPADRVVEAAPIAPPLEPMPALPPPPPPPDGNGRLVGGSFAIALGLAALSTVVIEAAREDGNPQFVASTFIPIGLASIGLGTYVVARGVKARRNLRGWRDFTHAEARPSGNGLLVAGVMGLVVGGVTVVSATVQARDGGSALSSTLFAIGGAGVFGGAGMLASGLVRRSRYRAWRQSTFLSATPTLGPTLGPIRGGLQLGVGGAF